MKIIDCRQPDVVSFEYLEIGELFRYHPEDVTGMKIEEIATEHSAHGYYNYVDVRDGSLGYLKDSDYVEELSTARIEIH